MAWVRFPVVIFTFMVFTPNSILLKADDLDLTWQDVEADVSVDHHGHGVRERVQVVHVEGVSVNSVGESLWLLK